MLLFISCSKDEINNPRDIVDDPSINTIYGNWKLVSRENYLTNEVFYKNPDNTGNFCNGRNECDVVLTLAKINITDSIEGHTISNIVFGSFSFNPANRTFTTIEFGGTKVGEPDWADNVWNNMYLIESYAVNDGYLRLYFNNKHQSITFEKE